MVDIGNCCICLTGFNIAQMGVLPCLHTFHCACVEQALNRNRRCPLCRQPATVQQIMRPRGKTGTLKPNQLPKKALCAALDFYDRTVRQHSADGSSMSEKQREELQICLNSLISTVESADAESKAQWEQLKEFLKVCSLAAVFAVLTFLFTLYWPVLSSLTTSVVRTVWTLITSLRDLLSAYWPEFLFGGLIICSFADTPSSNFQAEDT